MVLRKPLVSASIVMVVMHAVGVSTSCIHSWFILHTYGCTHICMHMIVHMYTHMNIYVCSCPTKHLNLNGRYVYSLILFSCTDNLHIMCLCAIQYSLTTLCHIILCIAKEHLCKSKGKVDFNGELQILHNYV